MQTSQRPTSSRRRSDVVPVNQGDRESLNLKVEGLIDELCALTRDDTLGYTVAVGELITMRLFDGDVESLRALGSKDPTFRKLAAHKRLPLSHAALWRSIGIYELVQRFPQVASSDHLGVTHLRAVLGLPRAAQEELLRVAERERWTGQKLETVAAGHRASADRRSRSNTTVLMRTLRRVEQAADDAETVVDARIVDHLGVETLRHAHDRLARAMNRINTLKQVLLQRTDTPIKRAAG